MTLDTERSKGEHTFIHEYTRTLLIKWAAHQIQHGSMPKADSRDKGAVAFLDHAIAKGWVSKDGTKVTSKGFQSAAARCKA